MTTTNALVFPDEETIGDDRFFGPRYHDPRSYHPVLVVEVPDCSGYTEDDSVLVVESRSPLPS